MKYDITWSLLIIIFSGNRLAQLPEAYRVYSTHVPVSKGGASWPARLTDNSSSSRPFVIIIIVIIIDFLKKSSNLGRFDASHSFHWYLVHERPFVGRSIELKPRSLFFDFSFLCVFVCSTMSKYKTTLQQTFVSLCGYKIFIFMFFG